MEDKLRSLVEGLLDEGKRFILGVTLSIREGLPIIHNLPEDLDPEGFSASTSAIFSIVSSLLKEYHSGEVKRVDVELEDGRHLIVSPVGECVLTVLTRERPSLGLIYLIIKRYCDKLKELFSGTTAVKQGEVAGGGSAETTG